jgi:hypothetical protein
MPEREDGDTRVLADTTINLEPFPVVGLRALMVTTLFSLSGVGLHSLSLETKSLLTYTRDSLLLHLKSCPWGPSLSTTQRQRHLSVLIFWNFYFPTRLSFTGSFKFLFAILKKFWNGRPVSGISLKIQFLHWSTCQWEPAMVKHCHMGGGCSSQKTFVRNFQVLCLPQALCFETTFDPHLE